MKKYLHIQICYMIRAYHCIYTLVENVDDALLFPSTVPIKKIVSCRIQFSYVKASWRWRYVGSLLKELLQFYIYAMLFSAN